VATKFRNSITRGFAAVGEPNVAVCLPPGTEIAFDHNVECKPSFDIGILLNKKIGNARSDIFGARSCLLRQLGPTSTVISRTAGSP